jgi:very-short-patch-repair endonuclease
VPIGPYVADFACVAARLIVELDGPPLNKLDQRLYDMHRDAWLRAQGWQVLRFSNDVVIGGGNIVFEAIQNAIAVSWSPSSVPASQGRGALKVGPGPQSGQES